jgi:hypothetical protein
MKKNKVRSKMALPLNPNLPPEEESDPDHPNPPSPQDWHNHMPEEMRHHAWAAMAHHAGLGAHPGVYRGRQHPGVPEDAITEADRERVQESEAEEAAGQP